MAISAPGLSNLRVDRLHVTYSYADLSLSKLEFRYLFANPGSARSLPLVWRDRGIQANMAVVDAQGHDLVYLPSFETSALSQSILDDLIADLQHAVGGPTTALGQAINHVKIHLRPLAQYSRSVPELATAGLAVRWVARTFTTLPAFDPARRLVVFSSRLVRNYLPFVEIPVAQARSVRAFVKHRVDILDRFRARSLGFFAWPRHFTWRDITKLVGLGTSRFPVPFDLELFDPSVPWGEPRSLHIRVRLPPGSRIYGRVDGEPEADFRGIHRAGDHPILESATHDNEEAYFYISREEALQLWSAYSGRLVHLLLEWAVTSAALHVLRDRRSTLSAMVSDNERWGPLDTLKLTRLKLRSLKVSSELRKLAGRDLPPAKNNTSDSGSRGQKEASPPRVWVRTRLPVEAYVLTTLLWASVLVGFLTNSWQGENWTLYTGFLSLLFLIVLTTVVYAAGKPLVMTTTSIHAALAVGVALLPLLGREAFGAITWLMPRLHL